MISSVKLCLCLVIAGTLQLCQATYFDVTLKNNLMKCYSEELAADALFVAEVYPRVPGDPIHVSVSLRGPREFYFNETSMGGMKTAFTTPRKGPVDVCIRNVNRNPSGLASLRILTGAAAKDFSQIAKKEHIDPVVAYLQTAEGLLHDYQHKQTYLVGADQGASYLVESTYSRVLLVAGVNIGLVIICNLVTVLFLRSFFRTKKII